MELLRGGPAAPAEALGVALEEEVGDGWVPGVVRVRAVNHAPRPARTGAAAARSEWGARERIVLGYCPQICRDGGTLGMPADEGGR